MHLVVNTTIFVPWWSGLVVVDLDHCSSFQVNRLKKKKKNQKTIDLGPNCISALEKSSSDLTSIILIYFSSINEG